MDGSDGQEWPSTAPGYRECAALEDAVLCSICRDYFNTPLSLLCGHSFCSQCIRSNIQFQERMSSKAYCPQCREPTDSRQIHANHQLREIVKTFLLARPHCIAAMSSTPADGRQKKRQRVFSKAPVRHEEHIGNGKRQKSSKADESDIVIQLDSTSDQEEPLKPTRPVLRQRSVPVEYYPKNETDGVENEGESTDASAEESEVEDSESDDSATPAKKRRASRDSSSKEGPVKPGAGKAIPRNWAQCPVCSRNFPMAIFNDHLDKCLANPNPGQDAVEPEPQGSKGKKQLQVPPKLLFFLEKEKHLRDRLKSYGLSNKGTKQELEQRYNRFRIEVQSALDRNEPGASYAGLAKRVMSREASEVQAAASRPPLLRAAQNPRKQAKAQGSEFDKLIKATKARDAGTSNHVDSNSTRVEDQTTSRLNDESGDEEEVCSQPRDQSQPNNPQQRGALGFSRQQ